MAQEDIERLLSQRKIERVRPDAETAADELTAARSHLGAAMKIADDDPTLALTGLYDALRKTISAHMRASGFRVSKGPGHHVRTGEYAVAALDHLGIDDDLDEFDNLRTLRNQSEYDALSIDRSEIDTAAEHVESVLEAVERELGA